MSGVSRVPAPLSQRGFRRLWVSSLISESGDWLLLVSLPIVVYQLTGSVLHTSYAFLFELAPAVLLGPIAGYLADRFDRRRLLIIVSVMQAIALLPLLAVHDRADLPLLYAVTAVQACLVAAFGPAKNALLPALVAGEQLVAANSLLGLSSNLGRLVGGPLGGMALATSGLSLIIAIDAMSFLAAGTLIALLPATIGRIRPNGPGQGKAMGGLREARPLLVLGAMAGIGQGIFVVLFVVFVARQLGGGESETGLLRGIQAVGAIAAGLLLASARHAPRPARLLAAGACVFGFVTVAIWNGPLMTTALPYYLVLFALVGAPAMMMVTGLVSLLQQNASEAKRGRVFGAFGAASDGGSLVGMLLAGLLGDRIGVVPMLNFQTLLAFAITFLAVVWLRRRPRPQVMDDSAGKMLMRR